ncbi:MAG: hypothetical protein LBQ47_07540, partial [Endomicrobium sp.]|nr:hypothetical protein [Endomicrobium sp.]
FNPFQWILNNDAGFPSEISSRITAPPVVNNVLQTGASVSDEIQEFLHKYPQSQTVMAFVEALIRRYGQEGAAAVLRQIGNYNDYMYRFRAAIFTVLDLDFKSGAFKFSSNLSGSIIAASSIGLANQGLDYAKGIAVSNARKDFSNMRGRYFATKDDRQIYFTSVDPFDKNDKTHAALISALDINDNSAERTFDSMVFKFIFRDSVLGSVLPENFTLSSKLREAILNDYQTKGYRQRGEDLNVNAWEKRVLEKYRADILLDFMIQYNSGKQAAPTDYINFAGMVLAIPQNFYDYKSRTNFIFSQTVSGNFQGQASGKSSSFIPYVSAFTDKRGFGRKIFETVNKINGSYAASDAVGVIAALQTSGNKFAVYRNEDKNNELSKVSERLPEVMLDTLAYRDYGIAGLSKNIKEKIIEKEYHGEKDVQSWADSMFLEYAADIQLDALAKKIEEGKKDKTLLNSAEYFDSMQQLIDDVVDANALRLTSEKSAASTLKKAKSMIENQDKFVGAAELKELEGMMKKNLKDKRKYFPKKDALKQELRKNGYDVNKTFYNLLSQTLFIEPALTPDGRVAGWSWALRSNGKDLGWGVKPADDVKWNNRWSASQGVNYDTVSKRVIAGFVSAGLVDENFTISDEADFNMRFDFVFSDFGRDLDIRLSAMVSKYRQLLTERALEQEAAKKDEADYSKIEKLLASLSIASDNFYSKEDKEMAASVKEEVSEEEPQEEQIFSEVLKAVGNLPQNYAASKKLKEAFMKYYNANKDSYLRGELIENLISKFQKDIILDALIQYQKNKTTTVWDYAPMVISLGMPLLEKYTSYKNTNLGNFSISASLRIAGGQYGPSPQLINKWGDSTWEGQNPERDNLLRSWEILQDSPLSVYLEEDASKMNDWINNNLGKLVLNEIRAMIPKELGVKSFSKDLEKKLLSQYKYGESDTSKQLLEIWENNQ